MNEKIALIYGTRPEFLKILPLIEEFRKKKHNSLYHQYWAARFYT